MSQSASLHTMKVYSAAERTRIVGRDRNRQIECGAARSWHLNAGLRGSNRGRRNRRRCLRPTRRFPVPYRAGRSALRGFPKIGSSWIPRSPADSSAQRAAAEDLNVVAGQGSGSSRTVLPGQLVQSVPGRPTLPVGPAGPVTPCTPAGPVRPTAPIGPVGPTGPTRPCDPVGPTAPGAPAGPTCPAGPGRTLRPRDIPDQFKVVVLANMIHADDLAVPGYAELDDPGVRVCAFAAGEILAINIAAADAPTSQRHAFLKD